MHLGTIYCPENKKPIVLLSARKALSAEEHILRDNQSFAAKNTYADSENQLPGVSFSDKAVFRIDLQWLSFSMPGTLVKMESDKEWQFLDGREIS